MIIGIRYLRRPAMTDVGDESTEATPRGKREEIGGYVIEDRGPLFTPANDDDDE